ncbi:hypothetical protein J1614_002618 [Plenodomus biglobosus]|nr:hypothetical protein J1614_002618 [Plenodomus biglobosus]
MQFSIIALLSIASVAVASPTPAVSQASQGCAVQQIAACCNQENNSASAGGLIGGILSGNILNVNCVPININILSVSQAPGQSICSNNKAVCCKVDANGNIDNSGNCRV